MAKKLVGTVLSTNMQKTAVVRVEEQSRHPLYQKVIKRHKRFHAHIDRISVAVGDKVEITETRPISKRVHFVISNKLKA